MVEARDILKGIILAGGATLYACTPSPSTLPPTPESWDYQKFSDDSIDAAEAVLNNCKNTGTTSGEAIIELKKDDRAWALPYSVISDGDGNHYLTRAGYAGVDASENDGKDYINVLNIYVGMLSIEYQKGQVDKTATRMTFRGNCWLNGGPLERPKPGKIKSYPWPTPTKPASGSYSGFGRKKA